MMMRKPQKIDAPQFGQSCRDLLAAAKAGDRAGVRVAMDIVAPTLEAYLLGRARAALARACIRDWQPQDVTSEVICRVFEDPPVPCPYLSPREAVFSYGRTIFRNLILEISGRTRARRDLRQAVDIHSPGLATHLASPVASAEERAIAREELSLAVVVAGSSGLAELKDLALGESGGVHARARGIARGTAYNRRTALRTALRSSPEFAHRRAQRRRPRLVRRGTK